MTTIEGNRLIAEFMGATLKNGGVDFPQMVYIPKQGLSYTMNNNELPYHSSWDWLMPVVEKCESIKVSEKGGFSFIINGSLCQWNNITYIGISKINATYKAVIEFIEWYNKQN